MHESERDRPERNRPERNRPDQHELDQHATGPTSSASSASPSSPSTNDESTRSDRFREAAIEAELETGEREETRQQAWSGSLRRLIRMSFGAGVVVLGLIMMPLPGPGMLVVATGLAILARDVAWADRLLQKVRKRLPSDADGKLPRSTIATMILLATAGIAASIWFAVGDINPFEVALFWRN